jgi:hypothetical protein
MQRVKIDELAARHKGKRKLTYKDIGRAVFGQDAKGKLYAGQRKPMPDKTKGAYISAWNRGEDLCYLQPEHLIRLAEFFGVKNVKDLMEGEDNE